MLTKLTRLFKHRWRGDALRQQVPSDLLKRLAHLEYQYLPYQA